MKEESGFDLKQVIEENKQFEEEIKQTLLFQQIKEFIKEYYNPGEFFDINKAISDFTNYYEEIEMPEGRTDGISSYFNVAIDGLQEDCYICVRAYDMNNGNVYKVNTWGERILQLKNKMESIQEAEDSIREAEEAVR